MYVPQYTLNALPTVVQIPFLDLVTGILDRMVSVLKIQVRCAEFVFHINVYFDPLPWQRIRRGYYSS